MSGETKGALDEEIVNILDGALTDMDDDFNTPRSLARLFELVSIINSIKDNKIDQNQVSKIVWEKISSVFHTFIIDIFGLKEDDFSSDSGPVDGLMQLIIELRQNARKTKTGQCQIKSDMFSMI